MKIRAHDLQYGKQSISQDDIDSVVEVLKSDFLTQGPMVPIFEEVIASYCNAKGAVAANSATSALHIACLALGVKEGDIVWTSANTFVASANCALYCGAKVDFVDIDPNTFNISITHLKEKLLIASKNGSLPKVLIPVHLCGNPCDLEEIYRLSREYGFKIIEDASHAIGAKYKDERIGNCKFSDITVFSFHPVKIITSGEGGMAVSNDEKLLEKLYAYRSHGITSERKLMLPKPTYEIWNYQQFFLGYNYRMTDLQAALGVSQSKSLDKFVSERNSQALYYHDLLKNLPLKMQVIDSHSYSSYHLFVIRFFLEELKLNQKEIYESLKSYKIFANLHYIPVYLQPYYENLGFSRGHCPEAEKYYCDALSLPLYPGLEPQDQEYVVQALRNIIGQ